jgi:hypothetical protein
LPALKGEKGIKKKIHFTALNIKTYNKHNSPGRKLQDREQEKQPMGIVAGQFRFS